MKERIKALSQKIIRPITENPVFFAVVAILLYIPSILYWYVNQVDWMRLYIFLCVPIDLSIAYLCCMVVKLCGRVSIRLKYLIKLFLYLAFYAFTVVEAFVILGANTRISPLMLRMLSETNCTEMLGLIDTYLFNIRGGVLVLAFGLLLFFNIKLDNKKQKVMVSNRLSVVVAMTLLTFLSVHIMRDLRWIGQYRHKSLNSFLALRGPYITQYTTPGLLLSSWKIWKFNSNYIEALESALAQVSATLPIIKSKKVVVIIGESFIKAHSSLYGYRLPTNPLLNNEYIKRNLYLFSDVCSPWNYTSNALRQMLSFGNQDSCGNWYDTPMWPAIYNYVGYYSVFISNQEAIEDVAEWQKNDQYLVSNKTRKLLFDWQNPQTCKYDLDLIEKYWDEVEQHSIEPTLYTIHLSGQHFGFASKYEQKDALFTLSDYNNRIDLRDGQKIQIMHYDNATLYNDKVVATIIDRFRNQDAIVVYMSDHGEEVYDYRDHMGRSHEPIVTPERAKYQFEVPFMIWMSDKYKENHPDVVAQVERSVDRPYMIDDLPHLMLDLAGIECEWFDPTRSVINDKFNVNRKRLLLDSKQDYDEIMKGAK